VKKTIKIKIYISIKQEKIGNSKENVIKLKLYFVWIIRNMGVALMDIDANLLMESNN